MNEKRKKHTIDLASKAWKILQVSFNFVKSEYIISSFNTDANLE